MGNRLAVMLLVALLCAVGPRRASTVEAVTRTLTKTWDTKQAFELCTWDGGIEVCDDGTVRLARSVLLQDEQGSTHYNNAEQLSDSLWAKKLFVIDEPRCQKAELFVFRGATALTCNGTEVTGGKPLYSSGWQVWDIPPGLLRKGVNEFVFSGGGSLLIENSLHPNRSAKSTDGGVTWNLDHLGRSGVDNGEYIVRLRLAQYPKRGWLTSPVIDLADTGSLIHPRVEIKQIHLEGSGRATAGTRLELEARTGPTPEPGAGWSSWTKTSGGTPGTPPAWQRYVRWRAWLKTDGAAETFVLTGVKLTATIEPRDMSPKEGKLNMVVLEHSSPGSVRRSQPFAHQGLTGRLRQLRKLYKLDEVVAPGKTEMEKMVLLRDWARHTAPKGWDIGRTLWVPPWDALVLLELNNPARALCMCTHFSTIFTQCALALGYNARQVVLDHHCVAEIWSKQFGKWVLMDTGNSGNPELNCHFEHNGVPLNALEIRRLGRAGKTGEIEVVYTPPRGRIAADEIKDQCGFANYRRFGIPFRNNYLDTPFPGELEQGESAYYGDFYLWWEDGAVPVQSPEYGNTSCRPGDFYWTLNQTEIDLQECEAPNTLRVTLRTVTPNFARFLASVDGEVWKARPAESDWLLHAGENTLRVKSVNALGAEGAESSVRLKAE